MKRLPGKIIVVALALALAGTLAASPVLAADATANSVSLATIPGCTGVIDINWNITVPDGAHTYELIALNPRTGTSTGSGIITFGAGGTWGLVTTTSAPAGSMVGDVYVLTVNVYHPVTLDDTLSITVDCATGAVIVVIVPVTGGACLVDDGRINPESCAGPVALYCDDTGLEVWNIDPETGEGSLAFTIDGNFPMPVSNTLLKKVGDVELWHLTSGEFQVNADQGEGKIYAFVFNGCPYDGAGYNANIDPNE